MGGIFSVISKLIWGDQEAQRQPQMDVQPEGVKEMEQLVAQVSDLKHGEYVYRMVFWCAKVDVALLECDEANEGEELRLLGRFTDDVFLFLVFLPSAPQNEGGWARTR